MKSEARQVKPDVLGILGEAHCRRTLEAAGAAADSMGYCCKKGTADALPYVVEVCVGVLPSGNSRSMTVGVNFSLALRSPFSDLDEALSEAKVEAYDPVTMILHLACPRVEFTDRGKTRAQLPSEIRKGMVQAVKSVTKHWTAAKRQADRNDRMRERDLELMRKFYKSRELTVKEAAYQVMELAYLEASANGTLPANARQIMYSARRRIILLTGKERPWAKSSYFTQVLLIDFMEENPDQCAEWDVVFDDRGHFEEPHTGRRFGVGTLEVRRYMQRWRGVINPDVSMTELSTAVATEGPDLRYRHVLFIEKEGFSELLKHVNLAGRYDLGILSTKGMSVTASRQLVEALSNQGVTIMVLHDFDKSGFSIVHTLCNDTRRYRFQTPPRVIDIGLRLDDVELMSLDSEDVEYDGDKDPRDLLQSRGATEKEANFLVDRRTSYYDKDCKERTRWFGKWVELNAMRSDVFIRWLEGKLDAHGVTKFVPGDQYLRDAWVRAWRIRQLNAALAKAQETLGDPPNMPADMKVRLHQYLEKSPEVPWDAALSALARQETNPC